jgi:hypothetical protein
MDLRREAAQVIADADFRSAWPIEVRRVLVRAANTEGDFLSGVPLYAVKEVAWALRTARDIERRMAKDIAVGEASLSHAQRKALAKA